MPVPGSTAAFILFAFSNLGLIPDASHVHANGIRVFFPALNYPEGSEASTSLAQEASPKSSNTSHVLVAEYYSWGSLTSVEDGLGDIKEMSLRVINCSDKYDESGVEYCRMYLCSPDQGRVVVRS